jgi:hypothetical protein
VISQISYTVTVANLQMAVEQPSDGLCDRKSATTALPVTYPHFADVWKQFMSRKCEDTLTELAGREDIGMGSAAVDIGEANEDVYNRFLHKLEKTGKHSRTKYEKGHIYMTELTEQPHEFVVSEITSSLFRYRDRQATHLGREPYDVFCCLRSTTFDIGEIGKDADEAFRPVRAAGAPSRYPNLVVEVGWCESLNDLDDDAQLWLSPHTTVQVRNTTMDVI